MVDEKKLRDLQNMLDQKIKYANEVNSKIVEYARKS
jgi:hypothetical protein